MSLNQKNILVTGGAGFIGCHLVKHLVNKYPNYTIVNFDKLTYAGDLANVAEIELSSNYRFVKGDICDYDFVLETFRRYEITDVMHLAAESHVDRSISNPFEFIQTNVMGTACLLQAASISWGEGYSREDHMFYHVSTDEVYGSLGAEGLFHETTAYDPRSPYSASKASSDHLVRAYFHTYKLPVVISNCSNNYGPNQYPEKLIPVVIKQIIDMRPIPVYGKGENIRDWLFVQDHVEAIDLIFHKGQVGETYNVGGHNEWQNIELVHKMCAILDKKLERKQGESASLISYVTDRKGHDLRYAIDSTKLQAELGWKPSMQFDEKLEMTIDWYLNYFNA